MTMTQPWPAPPPVRTRMWPIAAFAILAVILAFAALIVALNRPEANSGPTYTAAQKAEAKAQLCGQYRLAAEAMHIETSRPDDTALARISLANGALILQSASANPALEPKYKDAAHALAVAYQTQAAMGSTASPEQYRNMGDELNAKDRVMRELCGD